MKAKILLIILAVFGVSVTASASVAILDKEVYHCSDGKDYGVLRHYWGGWGPGKWELVGFCSEKTLTQDRYNGRYLDARESHTDVERCADEDTPGIRTCYDEFTEKNGTNGVELTPIIQGRVVQANEEDDDAYYGNAERQNYHRHGTRTTQ